MSKILAQAGISLADIYDIEGSIVGVDELLSKEVHTVHEMGGTIFAERLSAEIVRGTSGNILQSINFDIVSSIGPTPSRILGAMVFTDTVARVDRVALMIRDPTTEREICIFAWDQNEASVRVRMQDNGAALASFDVLQAAAGVGTLPSMTIGTDQPFPVSEIAFRGRSLAFGAGNVVLTFLVYTAAARVSGISSHGLPIPSW